MASFQPFHRLSVRPFTCLLLFLSLYAGFLLFGGLFTGLLSLFKGFSVGPLLWPLLGFYWPPFVPFFLASWAFYWPPFEPFLQAFS